jgi:hypothetical protein
MPDDPEAMDRLRRRLRFMTARPSLLCELMGFGHFKEMAMTRDGLLIGQPRRSVGFDAFIGKPTSETLAQTARLWLELDAVEQSLVLARLESQSIPPERIGIALHAQRTA